MISTLLCIAAAFKNSLNHFCAYALTAEPLGIIPRLRADMRQRIYRPIFNAPDKSKKVTKFLNRMLAMSLRDQKLLFAYFSDTLVSCDFAAGAP